MFTSTIRGTFVGGVQFESQQSLEVSSQAFNLNPNRLNPDLLQ